MYNFSCTLSLHGSEKVSMSNIGRHVELKAGCIYLTYLLCFCLLEMNLSRRLTFQRSYIFNWGLEGGCIQT